MVNLLMLLAEKFAVKNYPDSEPKKQSLDLLLAAGENSRRPATRMIK